MTMPIVLVELAAALRRLGLRVFVSERDLELRGGHKASPHGGLADWFQLNFDGEWIVSVEPWLGQVAPKYPFRNPADASEFILAHYRDRRDWPRSGFEV